MKKSSRSRTCWRTRRTISGSSNNSNRNTDHHKAREITCLCLRCGPLGKGSIRLRAIRHEKSLTKDEWLFRFIFLETVAGIPGMVAGMLRHMNSLRLLRHDNGWIHTLLEEAENERMHLMTFLNMKQPSIFLRAGVLAAQGVFFNAFFFSYLISPRTCHRFVGYLEEEAVRTYTHALNDIDSGGTDARQWAKERAPKLAIEYWKMDEDATIRDVLLAVRADEASHAHVNHTFSSMGTTQKEPVRER